MIKNLKNCNLKYSKWKEEYYSNKRIELKKNFNHYELETLNKLGIIVERNKYTEYEYHIMEMLLYSYYEEDEKGNIVETERLKEKGIEKKEYEEILDKFSKISSYYNL